MSSHGPRMPKHWDDYGSLAALIRAECCNYDKARKRCRMLGRECEVLAPTRRPCRWRSPMSKNPRRVPAYRPRPFAVTNRKQFNRALAEWERAQEIREESGGGRCTWFEKAILPILPEHLDGEYPPSVPWEPKPKGGDDEGQRDAERPGAEQRASRAVRHQPAHHQRVVRRRP